MRHLLSLGAVLALGSACYAGPTWSRDVAPLVGSRCVTCHRAGGIAPFSMEDHASASPYASNMAYRTTDRTMPPWLPSPDCRRFAEQDARTLTDAEIQLLREWARAGAPEGQRGVPATPPPPIDLGPPGLTVTTPPYEPQGSTEHPTDDYRCFKLPTNLDAPRQVVGFGVRPGNAKVLHHVILFAVDASLAARVPDRYECFGGPGIDFLGDPAAIFKVRALGAWAPGTDVTRFPRGTAVPMAAGSFLIAQMHYNLLAGSGTDASAFDLYFADEPVANEAMLLGVPNWEFAVPARTTGYRSAATHVSPGGALLFGVFPHMHLLGRSVRLDIDGQCAVDVPRWDFDWQGFYFYDGRPIVVNAGSTLRIECSWDNPTDRVVTWGEGTTDEMCLVGFYAVLR